MNSFLLAVLESGPPIFFHRYFLIKTACKKNHRQLRAFFVLVGIQELNQRKTHDGSV